MMLLSFCLALKDIKTYGIGIEIANKIEGSYV
jgi:hypothetical protein